MVVDPFGAQRECDGREFKGVALVGGSVESKEFDSCVFTKCSFRETSFKSCRFCSCRFRRCDLSLAHVAHCAFVDARFEDCALIGINWTEAAWRKNVLAAPVHFVNCALNHSVFMGLSLRGITVARCVAKDVDFSECDLTRADCTLTDFEQSRFVQTNLTEADFTGATHYAIAANLNTLKKTKFSLPEALSLLYSLDIILTES